MSWTPDNMRINRDGYTVRQQAQLAAAQERERGYKDALQRISYYANGSEPGICPYGCDTPGIAAAALVAAGQQAAGAEGEA